MKQCNRKLQFLSQVYYLRKQTCSEAFTLQEKNLVTQVSVMWKTFQLQGKENSYQHRKVKKKKRLCVYKTLCCKLETLWKRSRVFSPFLTCKKQSDFNILLQSQIKQTCLVKKSYLLAVNLQSFKNLDPQHVYLLCYTIKFKTQQRVIHLTWYVP